MRRKLKDIFIENLNGLKAEILAFSNEEFHGQKAGSINNSPGNLAVHLCGNLNHFLGKVLGNIDYERNRGHEFSVESVSREI